MRNDIRNTIILSVLLATILIFKLVMGITSSNKLKTETEALQKSKTELASLANVEIDTMQVYKVKLKIAEMDKWQAQNGKYFLNDDNSKITWSYISKIINTYCSNLELNFEAVDDNATADPTKKSYKLSGTSDPHTLCVFLNNLENQPLLYTIDETSFIQNVQQDENGMKTTLVNFEITINSRIDGNGKAMEEIRFRNIKAYGSNNFFTAKIFTPVSNPNEENNISTVNMTLLSLTPNKAFVKDSNNRVYILTPGAKVAYGYLESINWRDQSITFKLNKIGIYKNLTIKLNKE